MSDYIIWGIFLFCAYLFLRKFDKSDYIFWGIVLFIGTLGIYFDMGEYIFWGFCICFIAVGISRTGGDGTGPSFLSSLVGILIFLGLLTVWNFLKYI